MVFEQLSRQPHANAVRSDRTGMQGEGPPPRRMQFLHASSALSKNARSRGSRLHLSVCTIGGVLHQTLHRVRASEQPRSPARYGPSSATGTTKRSRAYVMHTALHAYIRPAQRPSAVNGETEHDGGVDRGGRLLLPHRARATAKYITLHRFRINPSLPRWGSDVDAASLPDRVRPRAAGYTVNQAPIVL